MGCKDKTPEECHFIRQVLQKVEAGSVVGPKAPNTSHRSSAVRQTALILGVSANTVERAQQNLGLHRQGRVAPNKIVWQPNDLKSILRYVEIRNSEGGVYTKDVQRHLMEHCGLHVSLSTVSKLLNKLGLKFGKGGRRDAIEYEEWHKERVTKFCQAFLSFATTKKFLMVFTDESYCHEGCFQDASWTAPALGIHQVKPKSKGKLSCFIGAGCKYGWVPGTSAVWQASSPTPDPDCFDYHGNVDAMKWRNWFVTLVEQTRGLVARLPEVSNFVVVMDCARYHTANVIPNLSKKTRLQLIGLLIHFKVFPAPSLFAFICQCTCLLVCSAFQVPTARWSNTTNAQKRAVLKEYVNNIPWVFHYLRGSGDKVLFTPPCTFQYQPIEMIWSMVKKFAKEADHRTPVCTRVRKGFQSVNQRTWASSIRHVHTIVVSKVV